MIICGFMFFDRMSLRLLSHLEHDVSIPIQNGLHKSPHLINPGLNQDFTYSFYVDTSNILVIKIKAMVGDLYGIQLTIVEFTNLIGNYQANVVYQNTVKQGRKFVSFNALGYEPNITYVYPERIGGLWIYDKEIEVEDDGAKFYRGMY